MEITIGSWTLEKAQVEEDDKKVRVRIIANQLTKDHEGERILPEAFNNETINDFLTKGGYIDWWHDSVNPRKPIEERSRAVLGKPVSFQWENGLPVFYADLTKDHSIVKESILPHLNANNGVFAASVGGSKRVIQRFDKNTGTMEKLIPHISIKHIAIAPASLVQNTGQGIQVSLAKAGNLHVHFDNLESFNNASYKIFENESNLIKALEFSNDPLKTTGLDAIRKQSLEGADDDDRKNYLWLLKTIIGVKDEEIPASYTGIKTFLQKNGCSKYNELANDFAQSIQMFLNNVE